MNNDERYLRLIESHRELQKQSSVLEDRILSIVECYSEEKSRLERELLNAKQQIADLKNTVNKLEIEKQRYKHDCHLAVQLLHQHPNEFISSTPPAQSTVIVPTFPPSFPLFNASPTATVTDEEKSNIIQRYLSSYFVCSNCHKTIQYLDASVQTSMVKENTQRSSNSIPQLHHV